MPHKNRMRHRNQTMTESRPSDQGDGPRETMPSAPAHEHAEGPIARTIEQATAKLPSDPFLWAACGCMGASLLLQMTGSKHAGLFVGQWVAPLMLYGIYNKIVKVAGSDQATAQA
jgi:hypothetical protein